MSFVFDRSGIDTVEESIQPPLATVVTLPVRPESRAASGPLDGHLVVYVGQSAFSSTEKDVSADVFALARLIGASSKLLDALRRVLTVGNKPDLSAKENRDAFDAAIRDGWAAIAEAEGQPQSANEQLQQAAETAEGSANNKGNRER